MVKYILLFFIGILSGHYVYSQDLNMHMLDSLLVRTETNPAYRFNKKLVVNLPGVYAGYYTDGISLGNFLTKNANGVNEISGSTGLEDLSKNNFLTVEGRIALIAIGYDFGKLQLSSGYNWVTQGSMVYTKDLVSLITYGNAPYIGKKMDVSTPVLFQSYHEINFGGSYEWSNFTLGATIKLLSGIEDISSDQSKIFLTTDDEIYQLNIDSDFVINTAGVLDYNGIEDINFNVRGFDFSNFLTQNGGVAFDVGLVWSASDRLSIAASVLDIGSINWNKKSVNYSSHKNVSYDGVDFLDYIDENEEIVLEDSLYALFDVEESNNSYTTTLGAKINLSTQYVYSNKLTFGINYHSVHNHITSRYQLSATGQFKIGPWVSLGLGYGISNNSLFNINAIGLLNFGPISAFVSSDNISSAISLKNNRLGNIRTGIQLGF